MKITRTGDCPPFLDYVTKMALIPRASQPSPQFVDLTRFNFRWIDIPSYQRGLVWDDDLFEELLESKSVFLGNAILGSFAVPADRSTFGWLPQDVATYEILIDGLQRFSLGTALMALLYPLVLADMPLRAADAPLFSTLKTHGANLAPIFQHNDHELQEHSRQAVKESYRVFRVTLQRWLEQEFRANRAQAIADQLQRLFLIRQIAPDTYHGFVTPYEVTNTFIGLNTIREQLNIIDWLRSIIIDKGSASHWTAAEIEATENRYTEVFTRDGKAAENDLIPFASIVKDFLEAGGSKAATVFPTWNTGLTVAEVETFLTFVEQMFDHDQNVFYREIRRCGALPLAGCIGSFYRAFLQTGTRPSFLNGGVIEDADLLAFLRACYRVVFDRHIARTKPFIERLLSENTDLPTIAEQMSMHFLGRALSTPVDQNWLVAALRQADKQRARQVFNACLLPTHGSGTAFSPHGYGKKAGHYQIDHMIPETALEINMPGEPEGQLLMNFAPIRRTANNSQSNLMCSQKLAAGGSYSVECANDPNVHPYLHWLVQNQANFGNQLDRQRLLQPNSAPPIGDERIAWLSSQLVLRL